MYYSDGVKLAWEIGSLEAANKEATAIEVDHIMLGILSLGKFEKHIKMRTKEEQQKLDLEKERLYHALETFDLNIGTMRRKLRAILPKGNGLPADNIFHRSKDCKKMFVEATFFSTKYLSIKYLFLTIIANEASHFKALLNDECIDIGALKSKIMFSSYKNN